LSDIAKQVAAVPFWWHSIDLGNGVVTPGHKSVELLGRELSQLGLADLTGKTVLDIGAWDGYFSFAAEQMGAKRVVALDHYVWSMDLLKQQRYYQECLQRGEQPGAYQDVPGIWQPATLPGKRGFDTAHQLLGSSVESIVGDFMTMDLDPLGTFDVVFFLGVLYHLRHPLFALERLRRLTRQVAFIETHAVAVAGHPGLVAWEFYEGGELAGDSSNWWGPTAMGLSALCRAADFLPVEILTPVPVPESGVGAYRLAMRAEPHSP
jgi:tRNA (mo5U34)-methyltransferase